MTCNVCGKSINEFDMYILNVDGDTACSKKCKERYLKDRDTFFSNISSDDWYKNYMGIEGEI